MIIAITASASPRHGHSETEVEELMRLFDGVLETGATQHTVTRMMQILEAAQPISATMRARMVRLDGGEDRQTLARVVRSYWSAQRAKRPKARKRPETVHVSFAPGTRRNRRS